MDNTFFRMTLGCLLLLAIQCNPETAEQVVFEELSESDQRKAEYALASMQTIEGTKVSLFAHEPILANPTNIAIDSRGRLYVCEATNYRLKFNPIFEENPAGDRILILEDTDEDGKADKHTVFYQGPEINAALGIAVLGDQVIVSCSPNVWIFKDTDGDDQADSKEILFQGISGLDDDHGMHAFVFGPDGRLYFNHGNAGKKMLDKSGEPILDPIGQVIEASGNPYREGMAYRCELDGTQVELLGFNFRNPFELTVDPYGTVWQSDNDDDGNKGCRINYVMQHGNFGYKDEIDGSGWREKRPGMHPDIPKRHWHQNDPGVVPNVLQTGAGSPCGITYYEGGQLPDHLEGELVHCEALENVVRAYPVKQDGAGYSAHMVPILKSQDPWFRPSDIAVASDGSIFISDWYDAGVGGNNMDDQERGRIFRVHRSDLSTYTIPKIEGVDRLFSPNQDDRYQAWRYLESNQEEAKQALLPIWQDHERAPSVRVRAFWALVRLTDAAHSVLKQALQDDNVDIRVAAIRHMTKASSFEEWILPNQDLSITEAREYAIACRYHREASEFWADLALRFGRSDRWMIEALGIGSDPYADEFFSAFLTRTDENVYDYPELIWRVRAEQAFPMLIELLEQSQDSLSTAKYLRALQFARSTQREKYLSDLLTKAHHYQTMIQIEVIKYLKPDHPQAKSTAISLLPTLKGQPEWFEFIERFGIRNVHDDLLQVMTDPESHSSAKAFETLMRMGATKRVARWMDTQNELEQKQFVERLAHVQDSRSIDFLGSQLLSSSSSEFVKNQIVATLGNSWNGQHYLFDQIQSGKLTGSLKNTAAIKLMNCWNPEIRAKAPQYLSVSKNAEGKVLPQIPELVRKRGNAAQGKPLFSKHCATCHQINGEGVAFGPDLSDIGNKLAKKALYTSIIYPNAGINFGYEGQFVKTKDGSIYSGILVSQTDEEITLKIMGGTDMSIVTDDVVSIEPMEQSLMTANLHALMSEQELIDLVEYLSEQNVDSSAPSD